MKQIEIQKVCYSESGKIQFPEAINPINIDNWNYPAEMKVQFGMAYDEDHFYLRYVVKENHPKAISTSINGPVWEDSCVEFFIAFNGKGYYNLEFNCIGNKLVGYGTSNTDREWLDEAVVKTINTTPSLGTKQIDLTDTPTEWSLDITIPKSIFGDKSIQFAEGQQFNVNFYKCGDKQKEPHFLSWNAIDNTTPNFHLPKFFGTLKLS